MDWPWRQHHPVNYAGTKAERRGLVACGLAKAFNTPFGLVTAFLVVSDFDQAWQTSLPEFTAADLLFIYYFVSIQIFQLDSPK